MVRTGRRYEKRKGNIAVGRTCGGKRDRHRTASGDGTTDHCHPSALTTNRNGHTEQIGQLTITSQNITASVSSLTTTVNGHTSSIGQLEITSNSISNRVTVLKGDYVKEAEISLMVKKDANGYISNALIKADIIDFTFTEHNLQLRRSDRDEYQLQR